MIQQRTSFICYTNIFNRFRLLGGFFQKRSKVIFGFSKKSLNVALVSISKMLLFNTDSMSKSQNVLICFVPMFPYKNFHLKLLTWHCFENFIISFKWSLPSTFLGICNNVIILELIINISRYHKLSLSAILEAVPKFFSNIQFNLMLISYSSLSYALGKPLEFNVRNIIWLIFQWLGGSGKLREYWLRC